jgi:hypothetical protein
MDEHDCHHISLFPTFVRISCDLLLVYGSRIPMAASYPLGPSVAFLRLNSQECAAHVQ